MLARRLAVSLLGIVCACSDPSAPEAATDTSAEAAGTAPAAVEATTPTPPPPPPTDDPAPTASIGTEYDRTPYECAPDLPAVTVPAPDPATVVPQHAAPTAVEAGVTDAPAPLPVDPWEVVYATVVAYGCQHLDTFGGTRVDGQVVVAGFTDDLDGHVTALEALVDPGTVRVERVEYRLAALQGIRDLIAEEMEGTIFMTLGVSANHVDVRLRADQEARARSYFDRFGTAVVSTVGAFRWAPDGPVGPPESWCAPLESGLPSSVDGVSAELAIESSVASGADFGGTVRFTNHNDIEATIETGGHVITVFDDAGTPVGGFTGLVTDAGRIVIIGPGDSADIGAIGGTASCRPELGYALPPGTYTARAEVQIGQSTMWTPPTTLVVR